MNMQIWEEFALWVFVFWFDKNFWSKWDWLYDFFIVFPTLQCNYDYPIGTTKILQTTVQDYVIEETVTPIASSSEAMDTA